MKRIDYKRGGWCPNYDVDRLATHLRRDKE